MMPAYTFQFDAVFARLDLLLSGLWLTVSLSFLAMALGTAVAIVGAWARTAGPAPVRWLVIVYVEIIRNTPFLVQIFFIFFGLPAIGIRLTPNLAALLAMVVNVGAYSIEILRAGIESVGRGQVEAGRALGLKRLDIYRFIVMRPALRAIFPALTSQFILLVLTSSVVSAISANDLASAANEISSATFRTFEAYFVVTAMYLLLTIAFSLVFATISRIAFSYPDSR
jgi:polar amino acid transport system permease protein